MKKIIAIAIFAIAALAFYMMDADANSSAWKSQKIT